jgi:hypothetical protein
MAFDANDLSPHEHFVVERTRAGEAADFTPMAGPGGVKPVLRAGFLRKLMLRLDPSWMVQAPGVRIKAARIEGALDLTDCSGAAGADLPALSLDGCEVMDAADVSRAHLTRLALRGCRLSRLVGAEARIADDLDLSDAAPVGQPGRETLVVRMSGARVGGDVIMQGAKLARPAETHEETLDLRGAQIGGGVVLGAGFDCLGAVQMQGARIGGALDLSGAQILNRSDDAAGAALVLDDARIGGGVNLKRGFKAEGVVSLRGASIAQNLDLDQGLLRNGGGVALALTNAEIGGQVAGAAKITGLVALQGARIARTLDLTGAEIANPLTPRGDSYGRALDAAGAAIGGAALFYGANIKGELLLAGARIGGALSFGGGRFIHGGAWAISAIGASVAGDVTFKLSDDGFAPHGQKTVLEGGARFDRAEIGGALAWSALELRGPGPEGAKGAVFSFADARIGGPIQARALVMQQDARIDVSGASCAGLDDDVKTGWGVEGAALGLDGFSYDRIENADDRWRQRLAWIRRGRSRFVAQPYAQLARVYARAGRREDARRVLLAQRDMGALHDSPGPFSWALSSLFGLVAGYGLAPVRAARALMLFFALGVAGVFAMNAQGALVTPQGRACNGAVEPALYALDVALPVIDLGQEQRCAPGRTARAELPAGVAVGETDWRMFEGAALWKWAQALYAVLGAILAALAVITFSGALRPRDK